MNNNLLLSLQHGIRASTILVTAHHPLIIFHLVKPKKNRDPLHRCILPFSSHLECHRRKCRLRIEPLLSSLCQQPPSSAPHHPSPGPKIASNPNAPKLSETVSTLSGNRVNLRNRILTLIRENDLDEASLLVRILSSPPSARSPASPSSMIGSPVGAAMSPSSSSSPTTTPPPPPSKLWTARSSTVAPSPSPSPPITTTPSSSGASTATVASTIDQILSFRACCTSPKIPNHLSSLLQPAGIAHAAVKLPFSPSREVLPLPPSPPHGSPPPSPVPTWTLPPTHTPPPVAVAGSMKPRSPLGRHGEQSKEK